MTGISFATDTLVRLRAGARVERGDRLPDWSTATELAVPGCRVQAMAGNEVYATGPTTRDAEVAVLKAFAPIGADILVRDRVRWQGAVYDVEGPPQPWRGPTGQIAHVELVLRKVDG